MCISDRKEKPCAGFSKRSFIIALEDCCKKDDRDYMYIYIYIYITFRPLPNCKTQLLHFN
jgi:hypothetical protein